MCCQHSHKGCSETELMRTLPSRGASQGKLDKDHIFTLTMQQHQFHLIGILTIMATMEDEKIELGETKVQCLEGFSEFLDFISSDRSLLLYQRFGTLGA
jgi:hypothetical protein